MRQFALACHFPLLCILSFDVSGVKAKWPEKLENFGGNPAWQYVILFHVSSECVRLMKFIVLKSVPSELNQWIHEEPRLSHLHCYISATFVLWKKARHNVNAGYDYGVHFFQILHRIHSVSRSRVFQ